MGTGKKEAARRERQGKPGDGMANVKTKGENFYRSVTAAIFRHRPGSPELIHSQECQKAENPKHVQGRQSTTQCIGKYYQVCIFSVARTAKGPHRAEQEVVWKYPSHLTGGFELVSGSCC